MNIKQSFVVLGTAALCGLALAQTPVAPTSVERIDALEKQVAALRTQVFADQQAAIDELAAMRKELAESREQVTQVNNWAANQATGAAELATVLDDSEQKGFTFGINPESRISLLAGWRAFAAGLQKDAPKPPAAKDAVAKKGAKPVARKNP